VIQEIVKLDAVKADARALIINCLKPVAAGQDVAIFCEQTQAKFGDIFMGGYKALSTNRFYTFGQVCEALMLFTQQQKVSSETIETHSHSVSQFTSGYSQ
jgi:hypothetical protein